MSLLRFFPVSPPLYSPFVSVCVCERSRTKSDFNCFFSIAPLFARVIIPDFAGGERGGLLFDGELNEEK